MRCRFLLASCQVLFAIAVLTAFSLGQPPNRAAVAKALGQRGLANAFYACLLNGLAQGLPFSQIQRDCETQLTYKGEGGLGRKDPELGPAAHAKSAYDPASLRATCGIRAGGVASGSSSLQIGSFKFDLGNGVVGTFSYTYGGKGEKGGMAVDGNGNVGIAAYRGMLKADAEMQKRQAVAEWDKAFDEWMAVVRKQEEELEKQGRDPSDWDKDPNMKAERDAAAKKLSDAKRKKDADPNTGLAGITKTTGSSECEDALQEAREIVGECQRSQWKSGNCRSLDALIKRCPDPTLIYVDPDAGYACRPKVDGEAIRNAWTERCHELKRPTPEGPDPCAPPEVDSSVRYVRTKDSVCGGPQIYVTPETNTPDQSCVHQLSLPSFEKSAQQIYVWGLNNLGGPIVVFGPRGGQPVPKPGPQPRPGPQGGNGPATPVRPAPGATPN